MSAEKIQYLAGANVWARWSRGPKFELYTLKGTDPQDPNYFIFMAKKSALTWRRTLAEITLDMSFRPFLLDCEALNSGSIYYSKGLK